MNTSAAIVVAALTMIPFHTDTLEAVRDGDRIGVTLASLCKPFGLDKEGQRIKLARCEWAVTFKSKATAADGKSYEHICLDIDSIPGWLFTLQTKRMTPEIRATLVRYQRECVAVLRNHFYSSPRVPVLAPSVELAQLREEVAQLRAKNEELQETWWSSYKDMLDTASNLLRIAGHAGGFAAPRIRCDVSLLLAELGSLSRAIEFSGVVVPGKAVKA